MAGSGTVSAGGCVRSVGVVLLLLMPWTVAAQATVDARVAEFVPSADHHQVSNGTAVVSSYQMQIFAAGTTQIVQTVNLGKPAPQSDGQIRVDFVNLLASPLPSGANYQARVAAVGPGGSSASELSNTFTYSTSCTYAISPTTRSSPAAGETTSVNVTTGSGCAWTAASHAAWLTVGGGSSGTGSASRTITVAQNTATSTRAGTVTIAGQTFTVTQAAAACTYSVAPTAISAPGGGSSGTMTVTTSSGCAWTVSGVPTWMTVTSATQAGSGTLSYAIAPNDTKQQRSATILVAGQSVAVAQAKAEALVAPGNLRVTGRKK